MWNLQSQLWQIKCKVQDTHFETHLQLQEIKSVDFLYWDFSHTQQGHVFDLNNQIKQNPAEMREQSWTVWKCEHSKMSESSKCQPTSTLSLAALRFLIERIAIDSLLILVKCHTQEALSGTWHRAALVCACFLMSVDLLG